MSPLEFCSDTLEFCRIDHVLIIMYENNLTYDEMKSTVISGLHYGLEILEKTNPGKDFIRSKGILSDNSIIQKTFNF